MVASDMARKVSSATARTDRAGQVRRDPEGLGLAGKARSRKGRRGKEITSGYSSARLSRKWIGRQGPADLGLNRLGAHGFGKAGKVSQGSWVALTTDMERQARRAALCRGGSWNVPAGMVSQALARTALNRMGKAGLVRQGSPGMARLGPARQAGFGIAGTDPTRGG